MISLKQYYMVWYRMDLFLTIIKISMYFRIPVSCVFTIVLYIGRFTIMVVMVLMVVAMVLMVVAMVIMVVAMAI